MAIKNVLLTLLLFISLPGWSQQNSETSPEEMLQLDESQTKDDEEDTDEEPTGEVVDEFATPQYGDKRFRVSLAAGFNTKSTITDLQPGVEHEQSKSPYYRLGIIYLGRPLFSKTGLAKVFHFGLDVIQSKSVSSHMGAISSTTYEDVNTIVAPKIFAETPLTGLGRIFTCILL